MEEEEPKWIKNIVWLLRDLGMPTVIILFIMALWTGQLHSPISEGIERNGRLITAHMIQNEANAREQLMGLKVLCRNTSRNGGEYSACEDIKPPTIRVMEGMLKDTPE